MSERTEITVYHYRASRPIRLYMEQGKVVDADELTSIKTFRPIAPAQALRRLEMIKDGKKLG